MSKWLSNILAIKTEKQKAEAKVKAKIKTEKEEICKRQSALEASEVRLEWRMVFGSTVPKKKKDTFILKDITRRNVWMETDFLYNQIKAFKPDELFHPKTKYALQWQPKGSLFRLVIPLDDPQVQENAIIIMSKFSKFEQKRIMFFFGPIDPAMEMYAPRVHPSSLVSYHTKNEVLKKLCDYFLLDKISVQDIQAVLMCDQYVWSATLYNLLPEDEQIYHKYLNEQKPLQDILKSMAKSYIDDEITLQEYEDFKYPDRKKLKEIENKEYPLPYEKGVCSICTKENSGIIKCHTCKNMVCYDCMTKIFSNKKYISTTIPATSNNNNPISFLLMHQKYCMKLGELVRIVPVIENEMGYLREYRSTTRNKAIQLLIPPKASIYIQDDYISEDENELLEKERIEKERLKRLEDEKLRLAKENPVELQKIREQFDSRLRKFERIAKDIMEYTDKSIDKTHTEMFNARNERLRNESIEKLRQLIVKPIENLKNQAEKLNLTGEFITTLLSEIMEVLERAAGMSTEDPGEAVFLPGRSRTTSQANVNTVTTTAGTTTTGSAAVTVARRSTSPSTSAHAAHRPAMIDTATGAHK